MRAAWKTPKREWTQEEIDYFNKKVLVCKRNDDWIVWVILAMISLSGIIYFLWRVIS